MVGDNRNIPGTFIFVGEEERASINAEFSDTFTEEGLAFQVGVEPGDDLIPFYRFQNTVTPGTFIFVGEEERASINAEFSDTFNEEGLAFYVYEAGSGLGVSFNRFQNTDRPGTFIFANPEESASIETDFPNFTNEGIAFEVLV